MAFVLLDSRVTSGIGDLLINRLRQGKICSLREYNILPDSKVPQSREPVSVTPRTAVDSLDIAGSLQVCST